MPEVEANYDFRKIIERIATQHGELLKVFGDFACLVSCALAMKTREGEYLELAKNYSREQLEQFGNALGCLVEEMQSKPFEDVLGLYYAEIGSRFTRDMRGEFYTPKPVCDLMARVTVDAASIIAAGKPIAVNEPACGSGGMILSLAECFAEASAVDLLRVTCQDVSKTACDMAYINLTLWGIPARVVWGDTIRNALQGEWRNVHWHRVGEADRERISKIMSFLRATFPMDLKPEEPQPNGAPLGPKVTTNIPTLIRKANSGQQEWVFE